MKTRQIKLFTEDQCNELIKNMGEGEYFTPYKDGKSYLQLLSRHVKLPPNLIHHWVKHSANYLNYIGITDFDHRGIIQVVRYAEGGYISKHADVESMPDRKIAICVQLTDPSEYEGGELIVYDGDESITIPKDIGMSSIFSTHTYHEVKPVTKGVRCSAVIWFHCLR